MRVGFAGEEKVGELAQHPLAMGLVAVQVVAQVGDTPWAIVRAPLLQPAASGGPFAVLFVVTILGQNKVRRQGHHVLLARCDQCRGDRDMAIEDFAIFES